MRLLAHRLHSLSVPLCVPSHSCTVLRLIADRVTEEQQREGDGQQEGSEKVDLASAVERQQQLERDADGDNS